MSAGWVARFMAMLALVAVVAGCSNSDNDSAAGQVQAADEQTQPREEASEADDGGGDAAAAEDDAPADESSDGVITEAVRAAAGRDIIYTITMTVAVDDVSRATRDAAAIAVASGGFVSREETYGEEDQSTITLKIPTDVQTDAVNQLEQLGEVTTRSRETRDVTQDVVDTESRIASQRASIARIRALLDQAEDLRQVIEIESELASREADLDALLRRQEELSALTSMATVTANFHEADDAEAMASEPDEQGFITGLRNGWDGFTAFGAVLLTAVGAVLPFAALALVVGVPIFYFTRARKRVTPAVPPAPPSS